MQYWLSLSIVCTILRRSFGGIDGERLIVVCFRCTMSNTNPHPMREVFTTTSSQYRETLRHTQTRLRTVTPHVDLPFNEWRSRFGKGLSAMSLKCGRMGAL